jgi:predicted Zn-dependent protease
MQMNLKINKQTTMKKLIFSLLFIFLVTLTHAQDMKKAKSYLDAKQLDKAKTEIDGVLAKSPNDGEANYLKARIYEEIAASDQYKSLVTGDARGEAFEAFKKAIADSSNMKVKLAIMKDQYAGIFNLYTGYYEAGAAAFNAAAPTGNKAGFEDAMNLFIKADNTGQYITENKWSNIAHVDTTLVLNIAKAALNAGKNDVALTYFKELADAHINGTKDGGAGNAAFILPYQWLTLHYKDAKDEINMLKYAALGKQLFPENDYFDLVLIDYYRDKKDNKALFAKYDELVAKSPDSLMYHFNYANDIFGYLYNSDEGVVVTGKDSLMHVLNDQLEKAYKINPKDVVTNWLYSQFYYNQGVDIRDSSLKIRSTKPEDVKKKADLTAQSKDNFTKAIPYGDKALTELENSGDKKSDRSRYKSIVNLMQKIYQSMNDNAKVKTYQDKYDAADTKFVN